MSTATVIHLYHLYPSAWPWYPEPWSILRRWGSRPGWLIWEGPCREKVHLLPGEDGLCSSGWRCASRPGQVLCGGNSVGSSVLLYWSAIMELVSWCIRGRVLASSSLSCYQLATHFASSQLILRFLCIFHVCLYLYLCVLTYHVCLTMRPCFSWL